MKPALFAAVTASALALQATPGGAALAEQVNYRTDPDHTFVMFEVVHFQTSTVRGRFNDVEGTVTLDREAGTGSADITIDTTSIDSGVADFDTHLKSPDFFDAQKSPTARFRADAFQFEGDRLSKVTGELTLLGKTLPVTLEAIRFNCYHQPVLKANVCGGDFETTIERSQWGMTWGIDIGVPDKVHLLVQIEAVEA